MNAVNLDLDGPQTLEFTAGYGAYMIGRWNTANPFSAIHHPEQYKEWLNGWFTAVRFNDSLSKGAK